MLSICELSAGEAECGNGRFCRNLVENAIMDYASRVYGAKASDTYEYFELEDNNFAVPRVSNNAQIKKPIGFITTGAM